MYESECVYEGVLCGVGVLRVVPGSLVRTIVTWKRVGESV